MHRARGQTIYLPRMAFLQGQFDRPGKSRNGEGLLPGIQQDVRHEDFAQVGLAYLKREKLLANDPSREANALIMDEV